MTKHRCPRPNTLRYATLLAWLATACDSDNTRSPSQSARNDAAVPGDAALQMEAHTGPDAGGGGAASSAETRTGSAAGSGNAGQPTPGGSMARQPTAGDDGHSAEPTETAMPSADDLDASTAPPRPDMALVCSSCGDCEEVVKVVSTMHTTTPVTYADPPPTSGPHNPCWARWGIHDTPTPPERWVHNLEHGGVVYLYNCPEGCASDVDKLTKLAKAHKRTLLTAYAALPARFAVVAWGHRLVTNCLDERAFEDFYAANFNHATESNDNGPNPGCPP